MRKLLTVLFALTVLFVAGGCKASVEAEVEGHSYTFKNNSSYSIKVMPDGQDWNSVTLAPNEQVTFEVFFDDILSFTYETLDPAVSDRVEYAYVNGVHTFVNKQPQYTMTFVNNSVYSVKVTCAGTTKTINAGSSAQITGNSTNYTYVVTGGEVNVVENGNTVTFTTKELSTITVENKTNKNLNGTNSPGGVSLSTLTWGPTDSQGNADVLFAPDEEACSMYPGGVIPTLKVGSIDTQIAKTGSQYLYYVVADNISKTFMYFRTTELISVSSNYNVKKNYTFFFNSGRQQVNEDGEDVYASNRVILIENTFDGKRSIQREIPVTRIK